MITDYRNVEFSLNYDDETLKKKIIESMIEYNRGADLINFYTTLLYDAFYNNELLLSDGKELEKNTYYENKSLSDNERLRIQRILNELIVDKKIFFDFENRMFYYIKY